jgi:cell division FtsZ-interacting protein ZapD
VFWFNRRQRRIENLLDAILREVRVMMKELDDLRTAVTKLTTVGDSMATLIAGLSAQIQASKDDPAAVERIAQDLSAKADEWAAAVTANTPAV